MNSILSRTKYSLVELCEIKVDCAKTVASGKVLIIFPPHKLKSKGKRKLYRNKGNVTQAKN